MPLFNRAQSFLQDQSQKEKVNQGVKESLQGKSPQSKKNLRSKEEGLVVQKRNLRLHLKS